ncbi:MAG: hypothetical protein HY084_07230 [Gemmatimonadetes bacterium]|nr:hypothetical protein [Gemmatimonadota bacterium]
MAGETDGPRATSSTPRLTGAQPRVAAVTERLAPVHQGWLKEFSVVMHRRYAYPPRHPSRLAAEEVALGALAVALEQQKEIAIAVTKRQLAIDGGFSDPKNPALGELAERLHRQGIGSITLRAGVTATEFDALLERIVNTEPSDEDDDWEEVSPLGPHVAIQMLSYDGLSLSDEIEDEKGPDATGERLWRELAEVALKGSDGTDGAGSGGGGSGEQPGSGDRGDGAAEGAAPPGERTSGSFPSLAPTGEFGAVASAERLANVISQRAHDPRFAAEMLKSMLKLGRHTRRRGRTGSGELAARLRDVLAQLKPGTMKALLESELDPVRKRNLIMQGVDALPFSVVLDWIQAAAASADETISHHLLRLLRKLAAGTRRRRDHGPDDGGEALRQAGRQLIEGWNLQINETDAHSALLERLSSYDHGEHALDGGDQAGADLIVKIALETDVTGHDVLAAADRLVDDKRLAALLGLLDGLPSSEIAGPAIRQHLLSPEALRRTLLAEPIDAEGARLLLARCDAAQADSLLDALAISEAKETRLLIMQRLREIGEAARDQILARLQGSPWQVQRNLLSLIGAMATLPSDLRIDGFARHEEPTVRVEAIRILVRVHGRREAAIHDALADPDLRVIRAALDAAHQGGVPRRAALRLLQCVQKAEADSDLRVRGIPLLGQVPLASTRDWLVQLVLRRRGFFRRLALQPKSAELLAALRVLAAHWRTDAAAATAIKLADKSGDTEVRDAVRAGSPR